MNNLELKDVYNKVYSEGSGTFYTFNSFSESLAILQMMSSWNDLDVLEIGCGEGRLATIVGFAGARHVDAVDYSKEAIDIACSRVCLTNVSFKNINYQDIDKKYDVVIMQGVLEHFDNPFHELRNIIDQNLKRSGFLITSSPSFINPRGYVWMTLQLLFDVPMSLTDLHFICPFDMEAFAQKNQLDIDIRSTDYDWAAGERTIIDFNKRLRNALHDAKMPNDKVDRLLEWLSKALAYHRHDKYSGATVIYKIWRL